MNQQITQFFDETSSISPNWTYKEYCSILEQLPVPFCLLERKEELQIFYANLPWCRLMGIAKSDCEDKPKRRFTEFCHSDTFSPDMLLLKDKVKLDHYAVTEAGNSVWLQLQTVFVTLSREDYVLCLCEDITEQKDMAIDSLYVTRFFQAMLSEKTAYAQVNATQNRITRIGGMWNLYNEIIHKVSYSHIIEEFINKVVHPEDRKHYLELMDRENLFSSFDNGIDRLGCQFRRIVGQNKMMWMDITLHLFRDPITKDLQLLGYIENIDAKKKEELRLLHETERDHMTNIYNRKAATTAICKHLASATPDDSFTFMILDVDDFKYINDNFGHAAGDQALIRIAEILEDTFQFNDVVGRFGGDEFIIFLRNMELDNLTVLLNHLYERVGAEKEPALSCSIGVFCFSGESTYQEIFSCADSALYIAKNGGKGSYAIYHDEQSEINLIRPNASNKEKSIVTAPAKSKNLGNHRTSFALQASGDMEFEQFISKECDMTYLVDPTTYNLIIGNSAFYGRIGLTKSECIGLKCYEVIQKRQSPCPFCSRANWTHDKYFLWRNMNDALEQAFLMKNKLVNWEGNEVMLAIAVDISNNKSIVDSMDSGATESHHILSALQRMSELETLSESMLCALETIGYFFQAEEVTFWFYDESINSFTSQFHWQKPDSVLEQKNLQTVSDTVATWLNGQVWTNPINIENPEVMLCNSYDMYTLMKKCNINNQRWIPLHGLKAGDTFSGNIYIGNISANFQNVSFMDSFSVFLVDEWKKWNNR